MTNGGSPDTEGRSERSEEEISAPKPEFRKWLNVEIRLVDNHYLATFSRGTPRIFHNMAQLLTAIEVESAKLGQGPTSNT